MPIVPKVVISGLTFTLATTTPLNNPASDATASPAATAADADHSYFGSVIRQAATTPASV